MPVTGRATSAFFFSPRSILCSSPEFRTKQKKSMSHAELDEDQRVDAAEAAQAGSDRKSKSKKERRADYDWDTAELGKPIEFSEFVLHDDRASA